MNNQYSWVYTTNYFGVSTTTFSQKIIIFLSAQTYKNTAKIQLLKH
jgi:hypothetical protein